MSELERTNSLEEMLANQKQWLAEAVTIVGKEGQEPSAVFDPASEVRNDSPGLELSTFQEQELRDVAGRFGIGAEYDIPSGADYDLLEGGKPWKIAAEATMSEGIQTFAGSPNRLIGQDEIDFFAEKHGVDASGWTEYESAVFIAKHQPGFVEEPALDTGFGYDIKNNFAIVAEATGQHVRIGRKNGAPVYAFRVDREDYIDDEGNKKYRNQPNGAALLGFMSDWRGAVGDSSSSIGLNTSNTYASRALDVTKAGLEKGREFTVGMYGRDNLRSIAEHRVPAEAPINQIPGELHTIAIKISQIEDLTKGI